MLELAYIICTEECCGQFKILDSTYQYATDNLGGWGLPNALRSDVSEAMLVVTTPDGNSVTIDITAEVLADDEIIVSAIALGLGAEITSGLYSFLITVNTGDLITPILHTFETSKLIYCLEAKKIKNLFGTVKVSKGCCSECDTKNLDELLNLWTYLKILEHAACCAKVDRFNELLEIINTLLNSKPCQNC